MVRLHTVGRKSGAKRVAIVGYYEDGPNLVTMAMNGWGKPEPAWWLNAQAQPEVTIDTVTGKRPAYLREATGDERTRLWARWATYDKGLDQLAAKRDHQTAVVVIEPR
jgi:deazaflavin-dependent oxidoreductase (nitroreductase family)